MLTSLSGFNADTTTGRIHGSRLDPSRAEDKRAAAVDGPAAPSERPAGPATATPFPSPPIGGEAALTLQENAPDDEADRQQGELSEEEERVVAELQKRDQAVHRHEMAHAAVGGSHAGAPSYHYQQGPDGKRYAIGGEVSIDTSPVKGDSAATIRKMQTVVRAALAPADPSGQDRRVAAAATAAMLQAQADLRAQRAAEAKARNEGGEEDETAASPLGEKPEARAAAAYGAAAGTGARGISITA